MNKVDEDKKYLIDKSIEEWKALSQYIMDIDKSYSNYITIITAISSFTVALLEIINLKYCDSPNETLSYIFYIVPIAFIVVFGYMGYQFRITAILRGHLASLEDKINKELGEDIFMWNSSLVEVYMAHNNVPNNTLMIPILIFVLGITTLCVMETFKTGTLLFNILYWILMVALSGLVLIPFFKNGDIRKKTYKTEEIIKKYNQYIGGKQK